MLQAHNYVTLQCTVCMLYNNAMAAEPPSSVCELLSTALFDDVLILYIEVGYVNATYKGVYCMCTQRDI